MISINTLHQLSAIFDLSHYPMVHVVLLSCSPDAQVFLVFMVFMVRSVFKHEPAESFRTFTHCYLPLWDLICFARWETSKYLSPQNLHGYGFSPVWARLMWIVKWPLILNSFPQITQEYGFSPVCVLMCTLRVLLRAKCSPHVSQE